MPAYRYYCPILTDNDTMSIEGNEFEHLSKVMRQQVGDSVELVDGKGLLAYATLTHLEKKRALFSIKKKQSYVLKHALILYQALTTWSHLEWIIEKAVELGATQFILFQSTHSPFPLSEKKRERLLLKSISALKQSGRVFLPKFTFKKSLIEVQLDSPNAYFGDLRLGAPFLNFESVVDQNVSIAFASGPESGFTSHEHAELEKKGFNGVRLHSNILRAETAPLAFLSLAHHHLMLKGKTSLIN